MNRRVLIQVTAPAVLIGVLLLAACLVSAWYINQLQAGLARVLSHNVTSLQAAEELEIRVRQMRFHSFLYLLDPTEARRERILEDERHFKDALEAARNSAASEMKREKVADIERGYEQYHADLARLLSSKPPPLAPADLATFADTHPINRIVDPCQELLKINKDAMAQTAEESERVTLQAHIAMFLVGLAGPVGGVLLGFGVARGLSRSIYRLSIRVQDMAQRLDQDVGSLKLTAGGDIQNLDQQLAHVVQRVEEVTDRLQQHQRELLRTEQLSAVGQLAASVAHEVRNPLTSIKMLVEVALRRRNPKPLSEEDLRVIHTEITRLEQTVQTFLDFARLPVPRRRTCDLREVVGQAVELVRARARQQHVQLHTVVPEQPVPVDVDRGQLSTVLVNLCLNALDAMPRGGELTLRLEAGDEVRLNVTDTGSGIPPEMLERLFTPFASSKPTGTGLGLSISRRILTEHGGRISGGNRAEGGACFTIALPLAHGVAEELGTEY